MPQEPPKRSQSPTKPQPQEAAAQEVQQGAGSQPAAPMGPQSQAPPASKVTGKDRLEQPAVWSWECSWECRIGPKQAPNRCQSRCVLSEPSTPCSQSDWQR